MAQPPQRTAQQRGSQPRTTTTGPAAPAALLRSICAAEGAQSAALVQLRSEEAALDVLAVHDAAAPITDGRAPEWLGRAAAVVTTALEQGAAAAAQDQQAADDGRSWWFAAAPLRSLARDELAAVYRFSAADAATAQRVRDRLALASAALVAAESLRQGRAAREEAARLRLAAGLAAAALQQRRLLSCCVALVEETAARLGVDRVSLGVVEGGFARLVAMNGATRFSRRTQLVRDIEAAMDEALEQDVEVVSPVDPHTPIVAQDARRLAQRTGLACVATLPMRSPEDGRPFAALTLERPTPFSQEEIDTLRFALDLTAPKLWDLWRRDRWVGARALSCARDWAARLVGPEMALAKVAALLLIAALAAAALVQGPVWVRGEFVIEPVEARTIAAPFDSVLEEALVEVGDRVEAGSTTLARLDTSELRLALAEARADLEHWRVQESLARSGGDIAQAQLAQARAAQAQARIDLLEARIEQATIVAPISGVVLEGDLQQQAGAPLQLGQPLFVLAPADALQATLYLPESGYRLVREGAECELAPAAAPADRLPCSVARITPVAQERSGMRAHRALAQLRDRPDWLKPGVSGAARVRAGSRSLLGQWTQPLLDWFRLRFWL